MVLDEVGYFEISIKPYESLLNPIHPHRIRDTPIEPIAGSAPSAAALAPPGTGCGGSQAASGNAGC